MTRKLAAEGLGTALLLATIVGSGIMAERLADGNVALALLCNALATGAMLAVLITLFAPLSGAHFNPAVTFAMALRRGDHDPSSCRLCRGADRRRCSRHRARARDVREALLQTAATARSGAALCLAEAVATFGLILTILGALRFRPELIASAVGLYIFISLQPIGSPLRRASPTRP